MPVCSPSDISGGDIDTDVSPGAAKSKAGMNADELAIATSEMKRVSLVPQTKSALSNCHRQTTNFKPLGWTG